MEEIRKLVCKNCGNDETFIARYIYSCIVDNQGYKLSEEEMDDEPEYQCSNCGSYEVHFDEEWYNENLDATWLFSASVVQDLQKEHILSLKKSHL